MDVNQFVKLPDSITNFGWVGERKAVSLLCLGFYVTVFALLALLSASQMPEWVACFTGLSLCYAIGFFALAADWFWARWFAVGLGYSGLTMGVWGMVSTREVGGPLLVFAVMHGLIALCLLGTKVAEQFEARTDWRERWQLDEQGVMKVRRAVTRAAGSLPSLIMFALAPREGTEAALVAGLGVIGVIGLLRGRTWGLVALATTGVAAISLAAIQTAGGADPLFPGVGVLGGALALAAVAPFVPGMIGLLARRAR